MEGGDAAKAAGAVVEGTAVMQADTAVLLVHPMASYDAPAWHKSAISELGMSQHMDKAVIVQNLLAQHTCMRHISR